MKPYLLRVWQVVKWALVASAGVIMLLVVASVTPTLFGERVYVVTGGSMEPAIPLGSAVITQRAHVATVKEGDILTFVTRTETTLTHRVVERVNDNLGPGFRTQGDANEDPDQEIVRPINVLGRVVYYVPFAGYILHFANQPATRTGIIVAAIVLMAFQMGLGSKKKQSNSAPPTQETATSVSPPAEGASPSPRSAAGDSP